MMTTDTEDFVIGGLTFTVGINTVRLERGRTSLISARNRYLYNVDNFATELERKPAIEALDPFYSDIVGALRSIDGNPKHPLITEFVYDPQKWEDFYWDNFEDIQVIIKAAVWTQEHNEGWYPKPQVTDEDDPDAAEIIANTLAAIDLDDENDAEAPPTEDILAAVQSRADIAFDNRGEGFLESETSLPS